MSLIVYAWSSNIPHLATLERTACNWPISVWVANPHHAQEAYNNLEMRVTRQTLVRFEWEMPWDFIILSAYKAWLKEMTRLAMCWCIVKWQGILTANILRLSTLLSPITGGGKLTFFFCSELSSRWTYCGLDADNRLCLNVVKFILYEMTVASRDQETGVISLYVHFTFKYDSFEITGFDDITSGSYWGSLYNAGIYCDSQAYDALNLGAVSPASKVADKPIIQIISYMKAIEFAQ